MSSRLEASGRIQRLDGKQTPRAAVTESDVKNPTILVRLLRALLDSVAALEQRYVPRRITFPPQDFDDTGTTKYRFPHNLGGVPDVIVVRWDGDDAPNLAVDDASDANTLVLVSKSEGTATIRLEEAP